MVLSIEKNTKINDTFFHQDITWIDLILNMDENKAPKLTKNISHFFANYIQNDNL